MLHPRVAARSQIRAAVEEWEGEDHWGSSCANEMSR